MIKKENTRITVVISKEVQEKLIHQAGYEDRTVSNLVFKILKDHYKIKDQDD